MTRFSFRDPPVWLLASVLMAVLAPILLLNNFHYLFRYNLYEFEDLGADSLQILHAKSFHEIYGQYSRWGFHHPGPAFFYVQAWGELFFHDWWHLVPRPLNAQMMATALLNVFFIGTALATAARWVGVRTVFLPLALGLAVLHVAAISFCEPELGGLMVFGNWPGYFLVIPFAALLMALASVSAGRGESLPFAALTGAFLVHGHISQAPLFVLPLSTLAYVGLLVACRKNAARAGMDEPAGGWRAFVTRPWRMFPRAHLATCLLLAVFIVPIALDLSRGSQSNFAKIIAFRQAHAGEPHKSLARSLLYFVQFGAYQWYRPKEGIFGDYTAHGMWQYMRNTRVVWEFWAVGMLGALAVMIFWSRRDRAATGAVPDAAAGQRQARRRYVVHLAAFTGLAVAMTLVWGVIMNGEMYYLNAFINFGIFYVGMLVVAAAAADFLCAAVPPGRCRYGLLAFCYVALGTLAVFNADRFRLKEYAHSAGLEVIAANVASALHDEPPATPSARYLSFYVNDTTIAIVAALVLEHAGHPCFFTEGLANFFGADRCPADPLPPGRTMDKNPPFRCWRIVPAGDVPAGTAARPLLGGTVLLTDLAPIDPVAGAAIRFGGPGGNDVAYTTFGWPEPERSGSAYRLSGARESMLNFRARPVPVGSTVRVVFDCIPFVLPVKKPSQRIGVNFNGTELGMWQRTSPEPIEVAIPASVWNAQEDAYLLLRFPDAATPASLGFNTDGRTVAFSFQRIGFRVETGPVPGAATNTR